MSDILKELNPQQRNAVTTTEGPLIIIAGAGTGKTTVIAKRIAYIIEKKIAKPSEILALTFTDKAAGEMEERVDQLVPYGFIDTWISTFHAFGDRILRDHAVDIGMSSDFKVLSRPGQVLFFQQNLFRFNLDYYRPLSNPTKYISTILTFISRIKDENITSSQFEQFVKKQKTKAKDSDSKIEANKLMELADLYKKYEELKNEAGVMDFGDQVTKTINLFKKNPNILKKYQKQFKYILVDEYQDTNFAQNEMVKVLASAHKNICVVGDDDQSIYKFRGAAISNILEFKKNFPKAKQIVLTENYRSTQSILDSAYKLISHNNPNRLEIQNKIDKRLKSSTAKIGIPPQEIFADTLSEEADIVATEIEKLTTQKKYQFRDIAILVRANSQAEQFLRALNMKGIPHKFVGSSGLYSQEEVSALISFLTAITNFDDSLNLFNLATSDVYNLSQADAIKILSYAKKKTRSLHFVLTNIEQIPKSELEISKESKQIIKRILGEIIQATEASRKENVGIILYNFLKNTNYLTKLDKPSQLEGQIKIQNIAKFFEKIKEFETIAKVDSPTQFIDYLDAMRGAGDDPATVDFDPDTDAVNVMTVHGSKGLEFAAVFMVNLVSDRFPSRARSEQIEIPDALIKETKTADNWHIEEERRLFYVGATRAKEKLYLSWSRDVGGKRVKKTSPFLLEALDKPKSSREQITLSPLEKIEKFAPTSAIAKQTTFFDLDVLKLTQGSIDDYLTCAFKYRYVHVLKLPIAKHHAIAYGSAIHATVAAFNNSKKNGKPIKLNQLLEIFENAWDSEGFLTVEHEEKRKMQGKIAISLFFERESKSKITPTLIEYPFKFSLPGVTLVGRFDRVDIESSTKVNIIDYKSSENIDKKRATAQAKESTQLALYSLYYYKKHKIIPQKVSLYFLETGIIGEYCPTLKDLENVEKQILETAQKIKHDSRIGQFKANPKYFGRVPACNYCAYNSICPSSLAK